MAAYFQLQQRANLSVQSAFSAMNAAEAARPREQRAAELLQATARMMHDREAFQVQRTAAVTVQRVYRGYRGRLKYLDAQIAAARVYRAAVFNARATAIQRVFRGFLSRKHTSDFRAQRAYIARITEKSDAVRAVAATARREQEDAEGPAEAARQRAAFEAAIQGKHHLLSTAVRAGVLRPPLATAGATTVFGTDVEEELRALPVPPRKFKVELIPLQNASSPPPPSTDAPLPPMRFIVDKRPYERGVHAETAWGVEAEREKLEKSVSRAMQSVVHGSPKQQQEGAGNLSAAASAIAVS